MIQNLKEAISPILGDYCPAGYKKIHPSTKYPYAVYDIDVVFADDCYNCTLEVNLWDDKPDTTAIDTLADRLMHDLNKYHYSDEHIAFSVYTNTRNTIDDPDKKLSRVRLLFEIKAYRKD